jgi:divalent metal cation (Fe/Co/Zn/Cd) transporter
MIATLVAIAIGLGMAICGAVIVWGGIEKTLAGLNQEADTEPRSITNGVMGLVWMVLAARHRAARSPRSPSPTA